MKYINFFDKFINESYGDNPSINWELISMAKDLSLDYLDEGFRLRYNVNYQNKPYMPYEVLEGCFSHDGDPWYAQGDTFEWTSYVDENETLDFRNLYYNFWFIKPNAQVKSNEIQQQVISKLREIYPDEMINE
jgi:hypothetical protein